MSVGAQREPRRFLNKTVTLNPKFYRANSQVSPLPVCFPINEGGLGDFICFIPALQWIAEECEHVHGILMVHPFVMELAKHFFSRYAHWQVKSIEDYSKIADDIAILGTPPGYVPQLNAMSSHLMDIPWCYMCNRTRIPAGWDYYPDLTDLPEYPEHELEAGKYVVLTPGGTSPTRTVPGSYWNPVIEHILAKGFTPVFLGKSHLHKNVIVTFGEDTNFAAGLDLRDRTGLLEAASIMKYAHATIGLDNGLLHLAGCTGGNLIFGYNIAPPETRRPRMKSGRLIEIFLTHEELGCIGCQGNQTISMPNDYRFCMYAKDDAAEAAAAGLPPPRAPKCTEMLFANDSRLWIDALNMLEVTK